MACNYVFFCFPVLIPLTHTVGYGFVDFDSPAAAQKAVAALKANGVQAQMAKVKFELAWMTLWLICYSEANNVLLLTYIDLKCHAECWVSPEYWVSPRTCFLYTFVLICHTLTLHGNGLDFGLSLFVGSTWLQIS